jgi:hypothetical protein
MKEIEEMSKLLREIIEKVDEHEEAIMLLGERVLAEDYYTVTEYASLTGHKLKGAEKRLLISISFQLSRRHEVAIDGDQFRIDILQEAFRWTF